MGLPPNAFSGGMPVNGICITSPVFDVRQQRFTLPGRR